MSGSGQHRRPKVSTVKKAAALGVLSAAGVALSTGAASAAEHPQQAAAGAQATTPDAAPGTTPAGGLMSAMTPSLTPVPAPGAPTAPPVSPDQASATTKGEGGGGKSVFFFNVPIDADILNNVAQDIQIAKNISGTNVSVPTLMGKSAEQSNADGGNTVNESHHNLEGGEGAGPPSKDEGSEDGSGESEDGSGKPDDEGSEGDGSQDEGSEDGSQEPPWGSGQDLPFFTDGPVLEQTPTAKSIPSLDSLPISLS